MRSRLGLPHRLPAGLPEESKSNRACLAHERARGERGVCGEGRLEIGWATETSPATGGGGGRGRRAGQEGMGWNGYRNETLVRGPGLWACPTGAVRGDALESRARAACAVRVNQQAGLDRQVASGCVVRHSRTGADLTSIR